MQKRIALIMCIILAAFLPSCRKKSRAEKRSEKIVKSQHATALQRNRK